MDNVTHTLAGLALARAGVGRDARGTTWALVLGSNLPDADVVTGLFGSATFLEHHRGITHSIVGAPLLALGLALALRATLKGSRLRPLLLCALVGVGGHVFMDLWTNYGTRVLSPFDGTWYAWDLVFIVDPVVLLLLLGAIGASWLLRRRGSPVAAPAAAVGLGLLLTYVGARVVLHERALDDALVVLPREGLTRVAALPSPINPFRWKILADAGAVLYAGPLDVRRGPRPLERREKRPEDAVVTHVRESSEMAAVFLDFSRFPWLEVSESAEGRTVSWRDLRFEDVPGLVSREEAQQMRRPGFVARVELGPDGRIRSESIRF
jgi:inner membrane protein